MVLMEDIDQKKFERARKQVENEKGWYSHFFAYIIFSTVEQLFYAGVFDGGKFTDFIPWWVRCITPAFWGIAILLHWLYVFKGVRFNAFYKKWEARKIKKFMEEEEEDFVNNSRK